MTELQPQPSLGKVGNGDKRTEPGGHHKAVLQRARKEKLAAIRGPKKVLQEEILTVAEQVHREQTQFHDQIDEASGRFTPEERKALETFRWADEQIRNPRATDDTTLEDMRDLLHHDMLQQQGSLAELVRIHPRVALAESNVKKAEKAAVSLSEEERNQAMASPNIQVDIAEQQTLREIAEYVEKKGQIARKEELDQLPPSPPDQEQPDDHIPAPIAEKHPAEQEKQIPLESILASLAERAASGELSQEYINYLLAFNMVAETWNNDRTNEQLQRLFGQTRDAVIVKLGYPAATEASNKRKFGHVLFEQTRLVRQHEEELVLLPQPDEDIINAASSFYYRPDDYIAQILPEARGIAQSGDKRYSKFFTIVDTDIRVRAIHTLQHLTAGTDVAATIDQLFPETPVIREISQSIWRIWKASRPLPEFPQPVLPVSSDDESSGHSEEEQIRYFSSDDTFSDVQERLRSADAGRVILVMPYGRLELLTPSNWQELSDLAKEQGKTVAVISSNERIRADAEFAGLRAFEDQEQLNNVGWTTIEQIRPTEAPSANSASFEELFTAFPLSDKETERADIRRKIVAVNRYYLATILHIKPEILDLMIAGAKHPYIYNILEHLTGFELSERIKTPEVLAVKEGENLMADTRQDIFEAFIERFSENLELLKKYDIKLPQTPEEFDRLYNQLIRQNEQFTFQLQQRKRDGYISYDALPLSREQESGHSEAPQVLSPHPQPGGKKANEERQRLDVLMQVFANKPTLTGHKKLYYADFLAVIVDLSQLYSSYNRTAGSGQISLVSDLERIFNETPDQNNSYAKLVEIQTRLTQMQAQTLPDQEERTNLEGAMQKDKPSPDNDHTGTSSEEKAVAYSYGDSPINKVTQEEIDALRKNTDMWNALGHLNPDMFALAKQKPPVYTPELQQAIRMIRDMSGIQGWARTDGQIFTVLLEFEKLKKSPNADMERLVTYGLTERLETLAHAVRDENQKHFTKTVE